MATVSSFDSLQFPTKSELRQFAELFAPLFKASSEEAKRQAVAALSQCPQVPQAVALFIGSQPIGISAIFLTCSQSITDETLITVARTQGGAHATAIARRENLSPTVIDALVGVRQEWPGRGAIDMTAPPPFAQALRRMPIPVPAAALEAETRPSALNVPRAAEAPPAPVDRPERLRRVPVMPPAASVVRPKESVHPTAPAPVADEDLSPPAWAVTEETVAIAPAVNPVGNPAVNPAINPAINPVGNKEESIRQELRDLIRHLAPSDSDRLGLRTLNETQEALLVRFARSREADHFATTLADALSTSRWLAERIMLDISGLQLATTLISLGTNERDSAFILTRLYPHLRERDGETTRASALLDGLDPNECDARVEAWRRADRYTFRPGQTDTPDAGRSRPTLLRPDRDLRVIGRR